VLSGWPWTSAWFAQCLVPPISVVFTSLFITREVLETTASEAAFAASYRLDHRSSNDSYCPLRFVQTFGTTSKQKVAAFAATGKTVATSQEEAVSELREAVLATRASNEWFNDDRQVLDLVQHSLARWVDDLGRSLRRADTATAKARQHSGEPDEEMAEELEEAITQIGSARDKLVAVAALVFGVPSLVPQKPGIKFEPRDSAVKNTLSELGAAGHAQAGQVKSRLDRLDDHPAITLRNQILHALSPLGNVAENCWIRRADLDEKGGIRVGGWSRGWSAG
jgi:hypothetical protein